MRKLTRPVSDDGWSPSRARGGPLKVQTENALRVRNVGIGRGIRTRRLRDPIFTQRLRGPARGILALRLRGSARGILTQRLRGPARDILTQRLRGPARVCIVA